MMPPPQFWGGDRISLAAAPGATIAASQPYRDDLITAAVRLCPASIRAFSHGKRKVRHPVVVYLAPRQRLDPRAWRDLLTQPRPSGFQCRNRDRAEMSWQHEG